METLGRKIILQLFAESKGAKAFPGTGIYGNTLLKIFQNPAAAISILFILSRAIFYSEGGYFDLSFFFWGEQGLDVWLLKNKPLESIFYMHGQPPLFNLLNALVLNFFQPGLHKYVFMLLMLGLGWWHAIILHKLLSALYISAKLSLAITFYFMLSPAAMLYENLYYYTQIELFLLTFTALQLVRFLATKSLKNAMLLFTGAAILILTRSMFHLVWLLGIALFMLVFVPRYRKKILTAAALPILLCFGWYFKNFVLYGKFASSTWLGMSLANVAQPTTGIAQIQRWQGVEAYKDYLEPDNRYKHIDVLQYPYRRDSLMNLNHLAYLQVSDLFMHESVKKIGNHPLQYLKNVAKSHVLFFDAASNYAGLSNNRETIKIYTTLYELSFVNAIYKRLTGKWLYKPSSYISLAYIGILTLALRLFLMWRKDENELKRLRSAIILFLVYNIIYIDVVGNFFEYSENVRFRFITIPSVLVLLALLLQNYSPSITKKVKASY